MRRKMRRKNCRCSLRGRRTDLSDDDDGYSRLLELYREMFADGYIFVMQDIRGRYLSEGTIRDGASAAGPQGSQVD